MCNAYRHEARPCHSPRSPQLPVNASRALLFSPPTSPLHHRLRTADPNAARARVPPTGVPAHLCNRCCDALACKTLWAPQTHTPQTTRNQPPTPSHFISHLPKPQTQDAQNSPTLFPNAQPPSSPAPHRHYCSPTCTPKPNALSESTCLSRPSSQLQCAARHPTLKQY